MTSQTQQNPELRSGKQPAWDKLYSSFYWEIELNPYHRANSPNVQSMWGYSKREGQDERKDKLQLLMRKIHTIFGVNGYIERIKCVHIYSRDQRIINKRTDRLVLILYPKTYQLQAEFIATKYEPLHRFLADFYDCVVNGKDIKHILPKERADGTKDDYMNVDKLKFTSTGQLDQYCAKLVRNDHPFDAVVNFRIKYLEKYPQLNPPGR